MKTTLFLLLFCISLHFNSFAQVYGNEWIQYNQKYYAFKIHTSGIHKIDFSALQNANITSNAFCPAVADGSKPQTQLF